LAHLYLFQFDKILHYSAQGSFFAFLQLLIFPFIIGIFFGFSSKNFYFLIPLLFMSLILGSGRVTIMVYAAFVYMTTTLSYRKFIFLNLPFSIYFIAKSISYISALVEYGSGFEYMDSN